MFDEINYYKKEYVFEQYTRIISNFKDYEKISKRKMLESIYKLYGDYNNIIDICTVRELKFLKKIINFKQDNTEENKLKLYDEKYEWERKLLSSKFLISNDIGKNITIPEEIEEQVEKAIKNVNWSLRKKLDDLNELLVGFCKMQGSVLLKTLTLFGAEVTNIPEESIEIHMLNNRVFKFYVAIEIENYESLGDEIPVAIYQDFYYIKDELDEERKKQGLAGTTTFDLELYKTLFYNDFDIRNTKIKKFLTELKKLPFFWFTALDEIKNFAMLNIDRQPLKDAISNVGSLKYMDLSKFFKIMDDAMDEMSSGALNGFTPNQAKKIREEEQKIEYEKEKNYVKQKNACLKEKDAKLFYKIYFALLEFTNNKYKIVPNLKIYNKTGIDPTEIIGIVDEFWSNKDKLILEFCFTNPYKFSKEELEITGEFKKGIRGLFIICEYEEEYTAIMDNEKVYMIKGINDNIDNIISYKDLPYITITSIIPFKDVLIYDGMFQEMSIGFGNDFDKIVKQEFKNSIKYYHL